MTAHMAAEAAEEAMHIMAEAAPTQTVATADVTAAKAAHTSAAEAAEEAMHIMARLAHTRAEATAKKTHVVA